MNLCIHSGNLTADPEMKFTQGGKPQTTFSIAVNERSGDREETEFIDFVCWDKLAETVAEYARKGRKVLVTSKYHLERWESESGGKRSRPWFRARNVEFLDPPPQRQPEPSRPSQQQIEDELADLRF